MKKAFEFFLVLIIFYGVYSAFNQAAPIVFANPNSFWVVIVSLIVAALFLVLYARIISVSAKKNLKEKITELEGNLETKDRELKDVFKIKKMVEEEAEKNIGLE